jgi:hypothetical protein
MAQPSLQGVSTPIRRNRFTANTPPGAAKATGP